MYTAHTEPVAVLITQQSGVLSAASASTNKRRNEYGIRKSAEYTAVSPETLTCAFSIGMPWGSASVLAEMVFVAGDSAPHFELSAVTRAW